MTLRRGSEIALWLLAFAFSIAGRRRWNEARVDSSRLAAASSFGRSAPAPLPVASESLAAARANIDASDPFRLDRTPPPLAFTSQPGAPGMGPVAGDPPPPPRFRPTLSVSGIVGPPWVALLDGVPAHNASLVVHPGDVLGDLRVRSIDSDLVVIQGPDTTWRLPIRKAWQ
jgi:hypothetical protein